MNYVDEERKVGDMIINFRVYLDGSFKDFILHKEEVIEVLESTICLSCNHREIFHDQNLEESSGCLISNCVCDRFIVEGASSYWNINRYNPIYNDPVVKELQNRLVKSLISLHDTWGDNIDKELLNSESKTMRIKRYNKFKSPE